MIVFRPLPFLTLFSIPALAVLIALGLWQLDRADQKRVLIAQYEASAATVAHADLVAPFCESRASPYAQRVVTPTDLQGDEVRFYGARAGDGAPGWRILRLTPAPDCTCAGRDGQAECASDQLLIIDAGFETLAGERTGASEVVEIGRPPRPNAFTSQNDAERGEFYRFDRDALARAFGVRPDAIDPDWWLAAHASGLPPGLAAMPPSRHIGYALTWFGLAATLIGVYFAFHHRQGRLGRRPDQ